MYWEHEQTLVLKTLSGHQRIILCRCLSLRKNALSKCSWMLLECYWKECKPNFLLKTLQEQCRASCAGDVGPFLKHIVTKRFYSALGFLSLYLLGASRKPVVSSSDVPLHLWNVVSKHSYNVFRKLLKNILETQGGVPVESGTTRSGDNVLAVLKNAEHSKISCWKQYKMISDDICRTY